MKVPDDEDLANHVSPESCGGCGNETAEALTDSGGKRRRAIELRNHNCQGADCPPGRPIESKFYEFYRRTGGHTGTQPGENLFLHHPAGRKYPRPQDVEKMSESWLILRGKSSIIPLIIMRSTR